MEVIRWADETPEYWEDGGGACYTLYAYNLSVGVVRGASDHEWTLFDVWGEQTILPATTTEEEVNTILVRSLRKALIAALAKLEE